MSTSTITGLVKDSAGTGIEGVTVIARLKPSGFRTSDYAELVDQSTTTSASGAWSLTLEKNTDITPDGTWYEIEEQIPAANGGPKTWAISADISANLFAALITPPPSSSASSYLTTAAGDARYAALNGPIHLFDDRNLIFGTAEEGLTMKSGIVVEVPTEFDSGVLLTGTGSSQAVVPGDASAYVGAYFTALDVSNNSSSIETATYNSTTNRTTLTFHGGSTISLLDAGQDYEISMFPGGAARVDDGVTYLYKPDGPRTVYLLGPSTMMYQRDDYGSVLLVSRNTGGGVNGGSYFRDFGAADIGCQAIENNGTGEVGSASPGTSEAAGRTAFQAYMGGDYKAFRDNVNVPRTKSVELKGATGNISNFANARTTSGQTVSPKFRAVGTYYTGGASADFTAYLQCLPTDNSGNGELEIGFENNGSPSVALTKAGNLIPYTDNGINLGTSANRFAVVVAGTGGLLVAKAVSDANASAQVGDAFIKFGAGGGSALDVTLSRAAAGLLRIDGTAPAGSAGAATGTYLRLNINGTYYKLALLADA